MLEGMFFFFYCLNNCFLHEVIVVNANHSHLTNLDTAKRKNLKSLVAITLARCLMNYLSQTQFQDS